MASPSQKGVLLSAALVFKVQVVSTKLAVLSVSPLLLVAMSALMERGMLAALLELLSLVPVLVALALVLLLPKRAGGGCERRRRCWLERGRSRGGALDIGEKEGTAPRWRISSRREE